MTSYYTAPDQLRKINILMIHNTPIHFRRHFAKFLSDTRFVYWMYHDNIPHCTSGFSVRVFVGILILDCDSSYFVVLAEFNVLNHSILIRIVETSLVFQEQDNIANLDITFTIKPLRMKH